MLLVTNEYHMKRASFIFKSHFQENGTRLSIEEHPAFDFGDTNLLIEEENKLTRLIHEKLKNKISIFEEYFPGKIDLNVEKLITTVTNVL